MRRVALALVVLPLVLAACGGGKKSAGTLSDPLAAVKSTAAIDVSKLPATAKADSGTYDVWIGDDGYVHRVRVTIKSKSSNATVTSDLSGYGDKVSVTVPPASQVYDSRGAPIPGLGG